MNNSPFCGVAHCLSHSTREKWNRACEMSAHSPLRVHVISYPGNTNGYQFQFPKTSEFQTKSTSWATATPAEIVKNIRDTFNRIREPYDMSKTPSADHTPSVDATPPFTSMGFNLGNPEPVRNTQQAAQALMKAQHDLNSAKEREARSLTPEALRDRLDAIDRAITEDRHKHRNLTEHVEHLDSALVAQRERVWAVEQQLKETPWVNAEHVNERVELLIKRIEALESTPEALLSEGAGTFTPEPTQPQKGPFPNSMYCGVQEAAPKYYVRNSKNSPETPTEVPNTPTLPEASLPEPSNSPHRALQALQHALTLLAGADWTTTPQNGVQRRTQRAALAVIAQKLNVERVRADHARAQEYAGGRIPPEVSDDVAYARTLLLHNAQPTPKRVEPDHMGQDGDEFDNAGRHISDIENPSVAETMVDRIMKPAKERDSCTTGDRPEEY